MKSFDLELAKAGHPLQTRDGLKARIVCYDVKGLAPILALISKGVNEFEAYYDVAGRNDNPYLDLFMAPIKKEGWINIYNCVGNTTYTGAIYQSEKEAIEHIMTCGNSYLATIKIEWEE